MLAFYKSIPYNLFMIKLNNKFNKEIETMANERKQMARRIKETRKEFNEKKYLVLELKDKTVKDDREDKIFGDDHRIEESFSSLDNSQSEKRFSEWDNIDKRLVSENELLEMARVPSERIAESKLTNADLAEHLIEHFVEESEARTGNAKDGARWLKYMAIVKNLMEENSKLKEEIEVTETNTASANDYKVNNRWL